ncbi:SusC/RagA family TonB-linked outer membrane protein [Flavivirga jejuensis]|uniref:SusC/RagA family TonB-linked outer membrane protein n=1 Tax=Flavivirga jejuensis TaxID=870487 RepID=A0ABT8WP34_9FLAO|nr:SusC/RagA family TonB-linked outer membrane protein [Flavivirga jejuensis]MDO5974739.1 SusC/RagA family TonB-linked outer membrane protein [Flavivirga jejuensis]
MNKLLQIKLLLTLLFFIPVIAFSQQVSGTVTDGETNLPLAGANVIIKGTSTGTISDFDGRYSLNVSSFPVTLKISSLGFETLEKVVSEAGTVNVTLQESAESLEEVVVTGLASSIKRSNAANAVASVSADDLVGRTPPQTLDGAMAGKFAGAQITAASGAPGGGMSVKLRGVTSINANGQPLYIIDGVYVNNNSIFAGGLNEVSDAAGGGATSVDSQDNASNRIADINPDDIANIEILKGASASAIYGARAAAGVVIITTKRGKQGKTKIKFTQALGWNEAINLLGTRKWTADLAENGNAAGAGIGGRTGAGALFTAAQNAGKLVDWEDEIYGEKGFITNTNLSVSGGNEKTTFFSSFTSNEEDGIVKNTGAEKKSFRVNVDHKITDDIKLSLTGNYINSSADRGFFNNENSGTTIGVTQLFSRPWDDFFPVNGIYPDNLTGSSNPIHTRDVITNNESVDRIIAGSGLDINLFSTDKQSLKLFLKAGFDSYTLRTTVFFPRELQFMNPVTGSLGLDGLTSDGTTQNTDANYSAFLVHNYTTDNDLNFKTQAGVTNNQFDQNTIRVTSNGLIASESNVDQSTNVGVSQTRLVQEDFGFFVQEEVNYQDKIIGTLGIRGDKSSNNGDANELFYYPKVSIAANLHNLFTMPESMQLKLRTAYGEAGNFAPNGALFTRYLNTLIGGNVGIVTSNTLGDPTIQPERQKELELGFDLGLFNKRVSLEFTYYKKAVEDLILSADNQGSSGFSFRWANAGELENKGVEIALNGKVFEEENFSWDTGIIFFKNESEITRLDVNPFNTQGFRTSLGTFRIVEGESATAIFGNDANGMPVVMGDSEPDFQMSFNNNLRYKDFTLSFFWHWKQGGENVNLTRLLTDDSGTSHDFDSTSLDPTGATVNGLFRLNSLGNGTNAYIEDASYLKLREVGLYYNIPSNNIKKWFNGNVSDIKVGLSGRNLINIFDYDSYDPEVSNFGSAAAGIGIEVAPFPSSKRFMFHLSVGL